MADFYTQCLYRQSLGGKLFLFAKLSPEAMLRGGGRLPRYEKSDILLVIHIITYLRSLKIMLMGESAPPSS